MSPTSSGDAASQPAEASKPRVRPRSSKGLPEDLKRRSVRRVAVLAWVSLVFSAVDTVISHVPSIVDDPSYPSLAAMWDLIGVIAIMVVSAAMIIVARVERLSVNARTAAGVAYLLLLAFLVSFTDHADGWWFHEGKPHYLHGIPMVTAIILTFPVIIPMSAFRAFVVALAMGATGPVALWLDAIVLGYQPPFLMAYVSTFPYLAAPVAAVLAHIVHRLGLEVKSAQRLGSYKLEERIGQGGMGEVWVARHRLLARPAAVKLITRAAETQSDAAIERFEREVQATAALRSPHTVQVYDFGVSDRGVFYYVMELLDGADLEQLVEDYGPQPPGRVVHWLQQACHSLGEAHDEGLVHRDLKPANFFLCRYGPDVDFLKVLDFGLVTTKPPIEAVDPRITAAKPPVEVDDARLTAAGKIIGTPAYMAPEMATGAAPVGARADIYSLGCVAYWALTGEPVFDGDSPMDVLVAHATKQPRPPSEATDRAIPDGLERIIMRCLAKSPDDRPQSVAELACELARCDVEPWPEDEARAWWNEHGGALRRAGAE